MKYNIIAEMLYIPLSSIPHNNLFSYFASYTKQHIAIYKKLVPPDPRFKPTTILLDKLPITGTSNIKLGEAVFKHYPYLVQFIPILHSKKPMYDLVILLDQVNCDKHSLDPYLVQRLLVNALWDMRKRFNLTTVRIYHTDLLP